MRMSMVACVAGMLVFQGLPWIPSRMCYALVVPVAVAILRGRGWRVAGCFGLGFLWAMVYADYAVSAILDPRFEGRPLLVTGMVAETPRDFGDAQRLVLAVTSLTEQAPVPRPPRYVQLNWYELAMMPEAGAECRFFVRLKRPHGVLNPGGFDYEQWLFTRGVGATGYIVSHPQNRCLPPGTLGLVERLRHRLDRALDLALSAYPHRGVIRALAVAEQRGISDQEWEVLRATGTAHLVSISGLHITLVAGLAYVLGRGLWSLCLPYFPYLPAPRVGACAAIAAAWGYTALAAFAVPAERSLLMVAVAMLYRLLGRSILGFDCLLLALLVVLASAPTVALTLSFWLSFLAVGLLIAISAGRADAPQLKRLVVTHLGITFGLAPLLAFVYQSIPLVSPLANLIAIPWTTFITVPLTLAGIVLFPLAPAWAHWIWRLGAASWEWLWVLLEWLAARPLVLELATSPSKAGLLAGALGVLVCWLPFIRSRYWFGLLMLGCLFLPTRRDLHPGELRLTTLDVGQGLAVVVETAHHVLVYDTGPSYRSGANAGTSVLLPFLRTRGIDQIDQLIISHADNDHAGGAAALRAALPIAVELRSPTASRPDTAAACRAGMHWQWDGITFAILHPGAGFGGSENDGSCVLKITAKAGSILLTGDIEAAGEQALLARAPDLHADILLVPHHGSRSSSTPAFIAAVAPRYAVFSAGYRNQFGFPASPVVQAYAARHAAALLTSACGAIEFEFGARIGEPRPFRHDALRYFHERPQCVD